ncbi:hypothetical protein RUND412_003543 [Rhizina undulata]
MVSLKPLLRNSLFRTVLQFYSALSGICHGLVEFASYFYVTFLVFDTFHRVVIRYPLGDSLGAVIRIRAPAPLYLFASILLFLTVCGGGRVLNGEVERPFIIADVASVLVLAEGLKYAERKTATGRNWGRKLRLLWKSSSRDTTAPTDARRTVYSSKVVRTGDPGFGDDVNSSPIETGTSSGENQEIVDQEKVGDDILTDEETVGQEKIRELRAERLRKLEEQAKAQKRALKMPLRHRPRPRPEDPPVSRQTD